MLEIKGYYVGYGYMGYIASCSRYFLFASEEEYLEVAEELKNASLH